MMHNNNRRAANMRISTCIQFFLILSVSIGCSLGNFYVESLENCNGLPKNMYFKNHGRGKDGYQYVDFNITLKQPLDNNILVEHTVLRYHRNKWIKLFTVPQKVGSCVATDLFGEIRHEIERLNGKPIGACPMTGTIVVNNYKVDPGKLRMTLPKGKIKLDNNLTDKKTGNIVECYSAILSN